MRQFQNVTEILKKMISIDSITGNEQELSDWLRQYLVDLGLSPVEQLKVEDSGDTVIGVLEGQEEGPEMMLNFHLDTFPVCKGWETDPLQPTTRGDKIYGLGSHDMKGGGACVLAALKKIVKEDQPLKGTLLISGTTDEENWSRGAHELINSGYLENCDYCLIPEPTDPGVLDIGARGRHVIRIVLEGETAHAAYDEGINAVVDGAKIVEALGELDLGYNERFDLPGSQEVIRFEGGKGIILVPERAEILIDRHLLPDQELEGVVDAVRNLIGQLNIQSKYSLSWDDRPTPAPEPYQVAADSEFVKIMAKNIENRVPEKATLALASSVADFNHFAVYGGVPVLVYGPDGGNTCKANEYVCQSSLSSTAEVYRQTVLDLLT
ncbi:MAG: M20 family metallopeptidase [Candidatus Bipolaricaulota bacterium]